MVTLSHWGFDGAVHSGRLVVHVDHTQKVVDIFRDLYAHRFPIARMEPVDAFGGSDDASMAANNTSAFNCRPVTGGTSWSQHSYGWAIDVNPVQNPYIRGSTVLPPAGRAHLDRSPAPGRIRAGDAVVQAFAARGWSWGGYWSSPRDYQHFSATGG
jgi:poly-gamma-glutamate synthesis protein (capsule biosynthesis protein)